MSLVQCLVLCHHALLVLKHLVELPELLGQEDGLVAHHRVDRVQTLVQLRVDLWQLEEALRLRGLPRYALLVDLFEGRGTAVDRDLFGGAGFGTTCETYTATASSPTANGQTALRAVALDGGAGG